MPISTPRPALSALLLLATSAGAVAAPSPAWDPSVPGTEACTEAAAAGDLGGARRHCRVTGGDAHPVDAFNLALLVHAAAPDEARALLTRAGDAGLAEADQVLGNLLIDGGDLDAGLERLERAARAAEKQ